MLENIPAQGCDKVRVHIYFLVEELLLLLLAAATHNISTEAERGTGYCFLLLRFCPLPCDDLDAYFCCCSWLFLFLSFRLRYFGYG